MDNQPIIYVQELIQQIQMNPKPTLQDIMKISKRISDHPIQYAYPYQLKEFIKMFSSWIQEIPDNSSMIIEN